MYIARLLSLSLSVSFSVLGWWVGEIKLTARVGTRRWCDSRWSCRPPVLRRAGADVGRRRCRVPASGSCCHAVLRCPWPVVVPGGVCAGASGVSLLRSFRRDARCVAGAAARLGRVRRPLVAALRAASPTAMQRRINASCHEVPQRTSWLSWIWIMK